MTRIGELQIVYKMEDKDIQPVILKKIVVHLESG